MIHLLFIGSTEVIMIVFIIIIFFGADKVPEIARGLGRGIRQVKDATNGIKKEINDSIKESGVENDFEDIKKRAKNIKTDIHSKIQDIGTENIKEVTKEIKEVKKEIDKISGSIKRKR